MRKFKLILEILINPNKTISTFLLEPNNIPIYFLCLLALLVTIKIDYNYIADVIQNPFITIVTFLLCILMLSFFALSFSILFLILNKIIFRKKIGLFVLLNLFILCTLPYTIEQLLIVIFGYSQINLVRVLNIFSIKSEYLTLYLSIFSPFFIWTMILCWLSIKEICNNTNKTVIVIITYVSYAMLINAAICNSSLHLYEWLTPTLPG